MSGSRHVDVGLRDSKLPTAARRVVSWVGASVSATGIAVSLGIRNRDPSFSGHPLGTRSAKC